LIDASLYPLFLPPSAALGFFVDMSGRGSGGPGGRGLNSVAEFSSGHAGQPANA
jgi:hypothetical protein